MATPFPTQHDNRSGPFKAHPPLPCSPACRALATASRLEQLHRLRNREGADWQAGRLSDALKAMQTTHASSAKLKACMGTRAEPLRAQVVLLPDDRSCRVAAIGSDLLRDRLMINDVRKRLGKEA